MKSKTMYTLTGGGGSNLSRLSAAFTMAEILLSLTIIGVVAAITLPSLTGNINERTWNTQRKALYARFSQAISRMPALNGYGTLTEDASGSVTEDDVAETFITAGLSKVLKINNICDGTHLTDCGIASKITNLGVRANLAIRNVSETFEWRIRQRSCYGSRFSEAVQRRTALFNPRCKSAEESVTGYLVPPLVCANFIYDLNGSKGPNTVGKDIGFLTVLYSSDSNGVAPFPTTQVNSGSYYDGAVQFCRNQDDARLPNKEEAISIWVNKKLAPSISSGQFYTSSSPGVANRVIHIDGTYGVMGSIFKTETPGIKTQCIKR